MANTNAPARIHAKVHGFRKSIPGGAPRLAGGWDEIAYGGTTEYVRADIVNEVLDALRVAHVHVLEVCEHNERVNGGARSEDDRRDLDQIEAAITKADMRPPVRGADLSPAVEAV